MTENENLSEKYTRMSSRERQEEFRQLCEQFPRKSLDVDIDAVQLARRSKSEHKMILIKSLHEILSFSYLTSFAQTRLLDSLTSIYDDGMSEFDPDFADLPPISGIPLFLDLNNKESEGIFDPIRATELEREFYRAWVYAHKKLIGASTYYALKGRKTPDEVRNFMWELTKGREDTLAKWREEFIARYGEEP